MSPPRLLIAALLFLLVASSKAQVTNGGFETGDLSGWTSTGPAASAGGTFSGQAPNQGSFQAVITSPQGGTVSQSSLETFLNLAPSSLNSLRGANPNNGGSAIKQTITVAAGAMLQFAWNFLPGGIFFASTGENDSVFFTIHLAAVTGTSADVTVLRRNSDQPTGAATGYQIFTTGPLAAGTYLLGLSTFDSIGVNGNQQRPTLLVDSVSAINPNTPAVPDTGSTCFLLVCAGGVLLIAQRRLRWV